MLLKSLFIDQDESKIFEALHHLNSFIIDVDGVVGWAVGAGRVDNLLCCFCYIQL